MWEANQLQAGENWALEVGKALADADVIVVLLSPESIGSEWVRREIEFAISSPRLMERLIPVLVRPKREVPWIFESYRSGARPAIRLRPPGALLRFSLEARHARVRGLVKPAEIFLSHASSDRKFVSRLAAALTRHRLIV